VTETILVDENTAPCPLGLVCCGAYLRVENGDRNAGYDGDQHGTAEEGDNRERGKPAPKIDAEHRRCSEPDSAAKRVVGTQRPECRQPGQDDEYRQRRDVHEDVPDLLEVMKDQNGRGGVDEEPREPQPGGGRIFKGRFGEPRPGDDDRDIHVRHEQRKRTELP
jgi:hypothetical protein